jgi:phosphate transport system protein
VESDVADSEAKLGSGHIVKRFDSEIADLWTQVLEMGLRVIDQLDLALEAFYQQDLSKARYVAARERLVNEMDMTATETCAQLLAKRAPLATDLRLFLSLSRIIMELERVGDQAAKISRITIDIFGVEHLVPVPELLLDVSAMHSLARDLLCNAVQAVENEDVDLAVSVAQRDKELNDLFDEALRRFSTYLLEDPRQIGVVIQMVFLTKALERVGDLAGAIGVHMIYAIKGKDVRYMNKDHLSEGYLDD